MDLSDYRANIRRAHLADDDAVLAALISTYAPNKAVRAQASSSAVDLVKDIRRSAKPGVMEVFLAEYGLSSDEGVALMCLAEALLRVPDSPTIDDLIEDKIAPSAWGEHLGKSSSSLVNASTWALMLTGNVLREPREEGLAETLRRAIKRIGEPVIRLAVKGAMREMGHQFVLGETIASAVDRAKSSEERGYTYSYDMLGEAALTQADADDFFDAYEDAIRHLKTRAAADHPRDNPGISIKLSALHPRYEVSQERRVLSELLLRARSLAIMAKEANIGLNIDAEEADRLDLSLTIIEKLVADNALAGWDGFGVVVQAYGKRASHVIDWVHCLASAHDRQLMVRLVKGAYWDSEIKRAQVDGLKGFPVFTDKLATDVSYICCAAQLFEYSDRLYPQFATHNAHTVASILEMAGQSHAFEFQRLHGMGEALHDLVLTQQKSHCRVYAPVGAHRDLLAYLVRRLLENGANSSFVNQLVDEEVTPEEIAADPFQRLCNTTNVKVIVPDALYAPDRTNSRGWDLHNYDDLKSFHAARAPFLHKKYMVGPLIVGEVDAGPDITITNPADPADNVGKLHVSTLATAKAALAAAADWSVLTPSERRSVLHEAAQLYEANAGELFAVLYREAGKTAVDAIAELREAVDFLRFYGNEAVRIGDRPGHGLFTCISPWNFPLAIFTGQIAAALAAGSGVLAKPADPTPIIAWIATRLLHKAGVPKSVLQLIPGDGPTIGATLTTDPRVGGICFTGSIGVAQTINRAAATSLSPDAPLIAETGGINAMIVDSTALPEQAVNDIVDGAFRSAGQRCSALRVLYVQDDVAESFLKMLFGAIDELIIGPPGDVATDVGPVISASARGKILAHIECARREGRVLKERAVPQQSLFVGPTVISICGIEALEAEIFGPVLHVATFRSHEVDQIIAKVNASGFGLTFGLHTRIDDRVDHITKELKVGNIYVNRNQIGAVVESQPFGGEGLSGTGPKAGGPLYVERFKHQALPHHQQIDLADSIPFNALQDALDGAMEAAPSLLETRTMRGPTGESNVWSTHARGKVLCLGPTAQDAQDQMAIARGCGCAVVGVAPGLSGPGTLQGTITPHDLTRIKGLGAVAFWGEAAAAKPIRIALSQRGGPIIPLIMTKDMKHFCIVERHLCIDTTSAGGNASLLAAQ
ncbi:MAG: bifunctional proline dehydrogenase/L-glutamate gamma-semialdehyde dehydrogenase PutA [Pseudomonadota bacterium]